MVILTVVFVVYFLFLIALLIGWKKAMRLPSEPVHGKEPMISIIVPVRNEEDNIAKLLSSIAFQEYRNFEVIVVDDHSEDETLSRIHHSHLKNVHIVTNPGTGKKAAITAGVQVARGSIIATTDADCLVSPLWLKQIRAFFRDSSVMMVFGPVRMEGNERFFDSMQAMEFASLIGTGASSAALGFPTMCNGANLAFRKRVFAEVNGYEDNLRVPSGDDEFLMRKIHRRYPGSIRFIPSAGAIVTTLTQPGPAAFFHQRVRWASKWQYNTSRASRIVALLVFLFQMAFVINWVNVFSPLIPYALFLIAIKMILEASLLLQVCQFLRVRWSWLVFFALQILYPLYVILVAAASYVYPFRWKQRRFMPNTHVFP